MIDQLIFFAGELEKEVRQREETVSQYLQAVTEEYTRLKHVRDQLKSIYENISRLKAQPSQNPEELSDGESAQEA